MAANGSFRVAAFFAARAWLFGPTAFTTTVADFFLSGTYDARGLSAPACCECLGPMVTLSLSLGTICLTMAFCAIGDSFNGVSNRRASRKEGMSRLLFFGTLDDIVKCSKRSHTRTRGLFSIDYGPCTFRKRERPIGESLDRTNSLFHCIPPSIPYIYYSKNQLLSQSMLQRV
jgi:hypothetical protein